MAAEPKIQWSDLKKIAEQYGFNSPHYTRAYEAYSEPESDEKLSKAVGGPVDHDPTEAQKQAGNYAKEHISFQGLPVSIENKAGSVRSGTDGSGKRWEAHLPADYGYIRRTEGADGDHVDCYLGPDRDSNLVVVIDQHEHKNKHFDEHKCMLGYKSERSAIDDYVKAFSDGHGRKRMGHVRVMSVESFKDWLKNGATTEPMAEHKPEYAAGGSTAMRKQSGDLSPTQKRQVPATSPLVDKAIALAQGAHGYRNGGAVESDDKQDMEKLEMAVARQGEAIDKLTQLLASPQIVERDENNRIVKIYRKMPE